MIKHDIKNTTDQLNAEFLSSPTWIRAPKSGPEPHTGFSRAKLYELAGKGKIKSVSIRERGQMKGTRLFHLRSILEFIDGVYERQIKEVK